MTGKLDEVLVRPMYSYAEADALAGVSAGTSKRWVEGYSYRRPDGVRVHLAPVANRGRTGMDGLSFTDLVEVVVIGKFKDIGFSLPKVRAIVDAAREEFDEPHPLSRLRFKTDGRDAFVHEGSQLHSLLRSKAQLAWDDVLSPFLETLDYRDAMAYRWWPLGKDRLVLVDPEYGFGLPVIAGSGVRTEIIRERFSVGDSISQIATDFNIGQDEVESALQFELRRAAA
jgi:uncharacterized protein (DUF433 family)